MKKNKKKNSSLGAPKPSRQGSTNAWQWFGKGGKPTMHGGIITPGKAPKL